MSQMEMLREVKVEDAIGLRLSHDLTQIIPGQFKGRLFTKGHVVREEDIPALLSIGKEHIYVMDLAPGYVHEDDAARRLAAAFAGEGLTLSSPHEGKVAIKVAIDGLAKINEAFVHEVNTHEQLIMSTVHTNKIVKAGQSLVGTRIIPLFIEESKIEAIEQLAQQYRDRGESLVEVKPFSQLKVGLITTGSEVFKGRITDKFGPIVIDKVAALGSTVVSQVLTPDDKSVIVEEIRKFAAQGVDVILLTGGMSVDPDDRTPGAIREAATHVISYGTPMLPGSMLMMAYLDEIAIMGLPGCVMHDPFTSFDVLFPRICAGEKIVRSDISTMGYGGMLGC
ncbi:molybdopterin-binding protein [Paenibacillus sp. N1-5-1-14]|uniref:molybdopterin-binding protein n=1 Tax=Paenibacillus radicibacter TaxID=2972488 RepID=UPI002158B957|nr:molybdopterin-binding protein [Paenibacillus radicibacter]MCR8643593.1 molybdopterin-binding protein [Paenibacillus radicibacter]